MKMKRGCNVKYVDASYSYAKNIGRTRLSVHEAYGYVEKNGNNIIISFIKKRLGNGNEEPALGLVIPDTALISAKNTFKRNLSGFAGKFVAVTWRDIVIFDSGDLRNECPIMYTEGLLIGAESDHVVLKKPETIRIYPAPIKNHPIKKPNYYIIPLSFITDIAITK